MPARRPDPRGPQLVASVLRALDGDDAPEPAELRDAARYLLALLVVVMKNLLSRIRARSAPIS